MALRADVDRDLCIFNWSAASLPERWLSFISLGAMILDWQIQRRNAALIIGLALEHAVLDIVSDHTSLLACLDTLKLPNRSLVSLRMGSFGEFPVTLNVHHDGKVSIFVDGPEFEPGRHQSAAIWVDKERLRDILEEITRHA